MVIQLPVITKCLPAKSVLLGSLTVCAGSDTVFDEEVRSRTEALVAMLLGEGNQMCEEVNLYFPRELYRISTELITKWS